MIPSRKSTQQAQRQHAIRSGGSSLRCLVTACFLLLSGYTSHAGTVRHHEGPLEMLLEHQPQSEPTSQRRRLQGGEEGPLVPNANGYVVYPGHNVTETFDQNGEVTTSTAATSTTSTGGTPSPPDATEAQQVEEEEQPQRPMGDWVRFNKLLENAVIKLPDTSIAEYLLFQPLQVELSQMTCGNINFGDIVLNPQQVGNTQVNLDASVVNLNVNCEFDFFWSYIFLAGNGHALVRTGPSVADVGLQFFSPDFNKEPPNSHTVNKCETAIKIAGLDFSGNIAAEIFNLFSELIIEAVEGIIDEEICNTLKEMGSEMISETLEEVDLMVVEFLQPPPEWRRDALFEETTMLENAPENVTLMSWYTEDSKVATFMDKTLDAMEQELSSPTQDLDSVVPDKALTFENGTAFPDGTDLGINVYLRRYMLDEDRAFTVSPKLLGGEGMVIADTHDQLTQTKITLDSVKVYGLDTFTTMKPFDRLGNYTLQNSFSWEFLSFEVTLSLAIKASTLPDNIIEDNTRIDPITETLKFVIGVKDIDAVVSVMMALDPIALGQLRAGSLLSLISMVPCVMESMYDLSISGLNMEIVDIEMPTVEGLVSPGLDRLLTKSIHAAFMMYKPTIIRAVPALMETRVRDALTELAYEAACPDLILNETEPFLDYRDLLLPSDEAVQMGASGEFPYGDLAASAYGILREMWRTPQPDGSLMLNGLLLGPLTEALSGKPGILETAGQLYHFSTSNEEDIELQSMINSFEFAVSDLSIRNLDTVVHPMALYQPKSHPYIMQTTLNMGPIQDKPLNVSLTLAMALDITDSPLSMNNIINVGFSVASLEVFYEALTMVLVERFMNFRIEDGLEPNCWLSTFSAPELDKFGFRVPTFEDRGAEILRFFAKISDLKLDIDCVQCSPGLASLPDIVTIFDESGSKQLLSRKIPLLLEEIIISDPIQVYLDRWIVDSPYGCPHRPEYEFFDVYDPPDTYVTPLFDSLTLEASDTIFFSSLVMGQIFFVLVLETHYPWEHKVLDPMAEQRRFVAPSGTDMFDWTNLDGQFRQNGIDETMNGARSYLGNMTEDNSEGVEPDLGINRLMKETLTDDGYFEAVTHQMAPIEIPIAGVIIRISRFLIRGLDTFQQFDVFKPVSPQTIMTSIHLRELGFEVEFSTGSKTNPPQLITMKLNVTDLKISVPLFAAIDKNTFGKIELGHLLDIGGIFPCLMSAAHKISFPQMIFSLGGYSKPEFSGFLRETEDAIRSTTDKMFAEYYERSLQAIPTVFDASLRSFVNAFLLDYIETKSGCSQVQGSILLEDKRIYFPTPLEPERYVDLRELMLSPDLAYEYGASNHSQYGNLMMSMVSTVREQVLWVDPVTNLSNLKNIIGPLTKWFSGTEGTLAVIGDVMDPFAVNPEIGRLNASFAVGFTNLTLENLDSVGDPMAMLQLVMNEPYRLHNMAGIGVGEPLRISFVMSVRILFSGKGFDKDVYNAVRLSMDVHSAKMFANVVLKIAQENLFHLSLNDALNPFCWVNLIPAPPINDRTGLREDFFEPTAVFEEFGFSISQLNVKMDCIDCQSPGITKLVESISTPSSADELTRLGNGLLGLVSQFATSGFVQDLIDRFLNDAERLCLDPSANITMFTAPNVDRSQPVSPILLLITGVAFLLIVTVVLFVGLVRWIVRRRHKKWIATIPSSKLRMLHRAQEKAEELENELNGTTVAMLVSPTIPAYVRYAMPVIIIGNIAFFLSGHLSLAAEIRMIITLAGEDFTLPQFYAFTIMGSTVSMWNSGAKEMAIFLVIFSVVWPYTKQLMTLVCWCAPPTKLSVSTRGSIYLYLDKLAKWSMIDIMVMLISVVAFRLKGKNPDISFLSDDFFRLDLLVVPLWGVYANLFAQMISQLSSHFIIYYHRRIVSKATREYEQRHALPQDSTSLRTVLVQDGAGDGCAGRNPFGHGHDQNTKERLCSNAFARPHKGHSSKLVPTNWSSYVLLAVTTAASLLTITGCVLPIVGVKPGGILSFVAGGGGFVKKIEFNVLTIAQTMLSDADYVGGIIFTLGYFILSFVTVATVLVTPILQAIALTWQWFGKMTPKQRAKMGVVIEIVGAWQYAEVFVLAVFIAAWQLGPVSESMMKRQCADYEGIFNSLTYYGFLSNADAHCYRVGATIEEGSFVLAAATLLLAVLNSFVTRATYHYFWDKDSAHKMSTLQKHAVDPEHASLHLEDKELISKIRPPPTLFTDAYRWVLRREHLGDRPVPAVLRAEQHPEAQTPSSHDHLSSASLESAEEEVTEEADFSEAVPLTGTPPSPANAKHFTSDNQLRGQSETIAASSANVAPDEVVFVDDVEA